MGGEIGYAMFVPSRLVRSGWGQWAAECEKTIQRLWQRDLCNEVADGPALIGRRRLRFLGALHDEEDSASQALC